MTDLDRIFEIGQLLASHRRQLLLDTAHALLEMQLHVDTPDDSAG